VITFIADLHLSINNRLDDFKKVLIEQIVPEANKSKKFYILGDIYHDRRPHPLEMNVFRDFLLLLKIPTLIIVGNHDKNLTSSTIDEILKWNLPNLTVQYPPYVDECEGLTLYLDHDMIEGAKLGPSNISLDVKGARKVSQLPKTFEGHDGIKKIDFYLFGHIHKAQIINKEPLVLYVGSIDHIDFAERNEDKFLFQIDETTKKYGYKKLITRPMIQIELDLGKEEYMFTADTTDAIVKVVVTGTKAQIGKFNEGPIREACKNSLRYSLLYRIIRENIIRSESVNESKNSKECFKEYAKLNQFSEEEVRRGMEILGEHP